MQSLRSVGGEKTTVGNTVVMCCNSFDIQRAQLLVLKHVTSESQGQSIWC